jgi:hypothetical protein
MKARARMQRYTEEEDKFIQDYYPTMGPSYCADKLGRGMDSLRHRARKLGVKVLHSANFIDLSNQTFFYWVVIDYAGKNKYNLAQWNCKCRCGKLGVITGGALRNGASKSCGCYSVELNVQRLYKGGKYLGKTEFWSFKNNAIKRKIFFDITVEDIENLYEQQNKRCALSGVEIYFNSGIVMGLSKAGNASIDRIDSSKGYTLDNIQIVDKHVNLAKQSLSQQEFIELCERVVEHSKKST